MTDEKNTKTGETLSETVGPTPVSPQFLKAFEDAVAHFDPTRRSDFIREAIENLLADPDAEDYVKSTTFSESVGSFLVTPSLRSRMDGFVSANNVRRVDLVRAALERRVMRSIEKIF